MPRPISSSIDQAPRRGRVENAGRLGHLDHERALAARQLVARADAGEDPVGHADRRLAGRHEAAHLGQSVISATWRMYVLLPAMFGPVMSKHACRRLAAAGHVVGHERSLLAR